MDLLDSFSYGIDPNDKKAKSMKKLIDALMPFLSSILLIFAGCAHTTPSNQAQVLQGHIEHASSELYAIDNKAVLIESWIK